MKNDKVKKWLYLILIFGGFFILRNFVPSGLDQAGWDGFLVLFVAVLLWLTEAVPMAVTAVFVLFFGAWVGFEKEANILANFASTGPFFLLAAMVIGQIFTKVGLGRRISLYVLPMFGNKAKAVLLAVMMGTCVVSMFLADIPTALVFFGLCAPILEQNGCEPGKSKFGKAIMLGIPVGAAIGGIGTPAGSGMNAVTMSLLKNICGVEISFGQWSLVGVPVALVSIVLAWLILCWLCKPEIDIVKGLDSLKEDRKNVGPLKGDELKFTIVFAIMVVLWFIPKQTGIDMYMTAWGGIFIMRSQDLGMRAAAGVMDERFEEFGELFGRKYGRIMCDHVEGADTVVLCMGSMSGTVKHVVKEMRAAGRKVGICRVVAFRPFPTKEVAEALKGAKNIAVIDRVSAMGSFGPLYEEVLAAMNYGGIKANAYSFVAGLGGRDIWEQTVENVIDKAEALGAKQEPCEAPIWIDLKEEEVVYNA